MSLNEPSDVMEGTFHNARGGRVEGRGMRIAITGASGFLGHALTAALRADGDHVVRIVRSGRGSTQPDEITWDPARDIPPEETQLSTMDAVVHLSGEPIAAPWTVARRQRIRESRIDSTRLLAHMLATMERGPRTLICASAIGYYGYDCGDELLTEAAPRGPGFLAQVVADWEAAADAARQAGIRVVHVRSGIVLDPAGGILRAQLPLFRLGLGGQLGSGQQWVSWIALVDEIGVFRHALRDSALHGPINAVAPHPVRNTGFTATLGHALHRPAFLPVPRWPLRLLLGSDAAREVAFASQRVRPAAITAAGFQFQQPELEPALNTILTPR